QQHLDGGVAADVPVTGEVNLAHPTGAETPDDVVGPNLLADFKHRVLLRGYSLSSLPTSDSVKEAPMYLKCGCTCSPHRYQPGCPSTSSTLMLALRSGRRERTDGAGSSMSLM